MVFIMDFALAAVHLLDFWPSSPVLSDKSSFGEGGLLGPMGPKLRLLLIFLACFFTLLGSLYRYHLLSFVVLFCLHTKVGDSLVMTSKPVEVVCFDLLFNQHGQLSNQNR